jgi:hypothetical protein
MPRDEKRRGEEGTAVIELVLSLFWILFAVMFLIGMGHTLINKQQGLVAARFAAFYESGRERSPGAELVTTAISSREAWSVAPGFGSDSRSAVSRSGLTGALGVIGGAFNSLMGLLGGHSTLTYTASTTPTRGLLPRMNTYHVSEHYALANGTWTCDKSGGDYLSVFVMEIGIPGGLPFNLSCCETYPRR